MKKYTVYLEQVNQSKYEVEARTIGSALLKAKREWNKENNSPLCLSITDETGEGVYP